MTPCQSSYYLRFFLSKVFFKKKIVYLVWFRIHLIPQFSWIARNWINLTYLTAFASSSVKITVEVVGKTSKLRVINGMNSGERKQSTYDLIIYRPQRTGKDSTVPSTCLYDKLLYIFFLNIISARKLYCLLSQWQWLQIHRHGCTRNPC